METALKRFVRPQVLTPFVLGVGLIVALLALGAQEYAAVSAMPLNRMLSLASSLVIALIGVIFLHDELFRALQERPRLRPSRTPQAPPRRSSPVA